MRKAYVCLMCLGFVSLAQSRERHNIHAYDEIKPKVDGLLFEVQTIGLVSMLYWPSRIASLTYLFGSGISIKVDPVVGIGEMTGYGANVGFHVGTDGEYDYGNRYGLRFGMVKVNAIDWDESQGSRELINAGYVAELYLEVMSYYKMLNSWRWHWGLSVGRGINEYTYWSELGVSSIKKGGTLRVEVGVGWLVFD